ncbi:MAG: serine/threonine protein kinase [Myxococcales bacterium]|nr:serine/threonine protein kinase [Myxococcales bacterium]
MSDVETNAPGAEGAAEALPRPFGSRYVLVDRIGVGGMAEIFLARGRTQSGVSRLAVVKLVLPKLAKDEKFSALLVQEAKLAAQLSHGNVVQTFDLGREAGRLYIAMEYVEGFDLNELLKRCSKQRVPLPFEFALLIVRETLSALDYAHRKRDAEGTPLNIVHRDVSPSNVLISFEGEVKLCDFGIARAINSGDVAQETIEGKASYMAPEHARGDSVDARADIFSASVILWELIGGRRMYRATPAADLISLAREGETPELPEKPLPDFERLRAIVRRGLSKSPAERYPTAIAMARDLDDYAMDNGLHATPLGLGEFVVEHFGQDILELRRARERAAIALEAEQLEPTDTREIVAPPRDAIEDDDASAEGALRATPITLPLAPTTAHASLPPASAHASGGHAQVAENFPTNFPPTPLPSMLPPPTAMVPDPMTPGAPPAEDQSINVRRLLALVLSAVATLAIGALILSRIAR